MHLCLTEKQYIKLQFIGPDTCYVGDLVHYVHYIYASLPTSKITSYHVEFLVHLDLNKFQSKKNERWFIKLVGLLSIC